MRKVTLKSPNSQRFNVFFEENIWIIEMNVVFLQTKNDNIKQQLNSYYMNIGRSIREVMKKKGMSVTQLAKEIPCERTNVYNIFSRKDISTKLLWRICEVLEYNFFEEFSNDYAKKKQRK